jgi:hypothetical protein
MYYNHHSGWFDISPEISRYLKQNTKIENIPDNKED